jgi:nucleotide-binding universal stress UspA family protein
MVRDTFGRAPFAMKSIKKILVPLDLSPASEPVLETARLLADAFTASLHLLYVISCPLVAPDSVERDRADACARLDERCTWADRRLRHATVACAVGIPASEIARYAAENSIDLIVMGTHQHGTAHQMATASIAEAVIRSTPCAVVTVKGGPASDTMSDYAAASAAIV